MLTLHFIHTKIISISPILDSVLQFVVFWLNRPELQCWIIPFTVWLQHLSFEISHGSGNLSFMSSLFPNSSLQDWLSNNRTTGSKGVLFDRISGQIHHTIAMWIKFVNLNPPMWSSYKSSCYRSVEILCRTAWVRAPESKALHLNHHYSRFTSGKPTVITVCVTDRIAVYS